MRREAKKKKKEATKPEVLDLKKPLVDKDWSGGTYLLVPIFNQMVTMFVGEYGDVRKYFRPSEKDRAMTRILSGVDMSGDASDARGSTTTTDATSLIILKKLDLGDDEDVAALYHEALHVALNIVHREGLAIGDSGEILTYLQGFIAKGLIRQLRKGIYGTLGADGKAHPNISNIPKCEF